MWFQALVLALLSVVGLGSCGYYGGGHSHYYPVVYSRPVYRRIVYSGGHGHGYGGGYGGYYGGGYKSHYGGGYGGYGGWW